MRKTGEMKDRAMESPTALGVVGGVIGASVGMALARRSRAKMHDVYENVRGNRDYGYSGRETYLEPTYPAVGTAEYYREGKGPDLVGEAGEFSGRGLSQEQEGSDLKSKVSDKASEVRSKVQGKVQDVRESLSDKASQIRGRTSDWRERMPSKGEAQSQMSDLYHRAINDQPLVLALCTIGLGAIASFLLPMTQKEREVAQPLKQRARETISSANEQVEARISGDSGEQASDEGTGFGTQGQSRIINPNEQPTAPTGPVLH